MIHICYGLTDSDGRYSKFVATSIQSLFENTRDDVKIHLLHDSTLTQDNRDRFIELVKNFNQSIEFHDLSGDVLESLKESIGQIILDRFSIGTFFRLFIPYVVNEPRAIYIDADTIVNLDVADVWSIELRNFMIAAPNAKLVSDLLENSTERFFLFERNFVDYRDYFVANLLILDLNSLRNAFPISEMQTDLISLCAKYFRKYPESNCADQDFLNYIFSRDYLKLPEKISYIIANEQETQKIPRSILQFSSHKLGINTKNLFNRLWFEYFYKTPFFNLDLFANLFDTLIPLIGNTLYQVQLGKPISLDNMNYELLRRL